jgi:hypothetical protein
MQTNYKLLVNKKDVIINTTLRPIKYKYKSYIINSQARGAFNNN